MTFYNTSVSGTKKYLLTVPFKKKNGKRKQSVLQHVKDQIFLSVTLAQADTDNTLQYYSATT